MLVATVCLLVVLLSAHDGHANGGGGFIAQKSIGIPGSDSIEFSGQQPVSGLATHSHHHVQYVDTPSTYQQRVTGGGGGSGPLHLATNTVHRMMFVDTPSSFSFSTSGGGPTIGAGGLSPVAIASGSTGGGGSLRSPGYIAQKNIGTYGIDDGISGIRGGVVGHSGSIGGIRGGVVGRPSSIGGIGGVISGQPGSVGTLGTTYGGGGGGVSVLGGGSGGVIQLPVNSRHHIEYVDTPSSGNYQPLSIEVPSTDLGVDLNFRSSSSLKVTQQHQSSPGSYQETSSVDEPIRLSHTVHRPIIQELRETIVPSRRIVQEVRPVQEEIQTIIHTKNGPVVRGGGGTRYPSGVSSAGIYPGPGISPGSVISPSGGIISGVHSGTMVIDDSSYLAGTRGFQSAPGHLGTSGLSVGAVQGHYPVSSIGSVGGGHIGSIATSPLGAGGYPVGSIATSSLGAGGYPVGSTGFKTKPGHSGISGISGGGVVGHGAASGGHAGSIGPAGYSSVGSPQHRYGGSSSDGLSSSADRRFYDGSYAAIGQKKI